MKRNYFLILFISLSTVLFSNEITYNVKDFGAKGCGTKVETAILQKAIDSCYNAGGGTVLFPSGKYLSATLVLKDNVGIYLSAGAQLIASDQKELYVVKTNILDTGSQSTPMLIYAKGAKNISIRGEGEIMAQPQYYKVPLSYSPQDFIAKEMLIAMNAGVELTNWKWKDPNVTLIYLTECKDISISGVRLLHSAFWTLHVHWCERVNIDGIYIQRSRKSSKCRWY